MVVVPGSEGDFGVLHGHAPLISTVRPGVLEVFQGNKAEQRFLVAGGFAEVTPERCTVLAEEAVPFEEVTPEQLAERERAAERELTDAATDAEKAAAAEKPRRRQGPAAGPGLLRQPLMFTSQREIMLSSLHRPAIASRRGVRFITLRSELTCRRGLSSRWATGHSTRSLGIGSTRRRSIPRSCATSRPRPWSSATAATTASISAASSPTIPPSSRRSTRWVDEEIQHGMALGRWAQLADPSWDFDAAFARFRAGYQLPLDATASVRGSQAGEMMARCIVETGTSSYYSALKDATEEPVLKQICAKIAADEFRHYKLFYEHMRRCLERDRLGRWARLRVGWSRIAESEDDELAYAYYAANEPDGAAYDRKRARQAYARRAYPLYRPGHVQRAMAMVLKASRPAAAGPLNAADDPRRPWFLRPLPPGLRRYGAAAASADSRGRRIPLTTAS